MAALCIDSSRQVRHLHSPTMLGAMMSVASQLKKLGSSALGLAFMLGVIGIGVALLTGAATFSIWVLKWTFPAFAFTLLISIVLLAPLSLIPAARGFSAVGFVVASAAFSAILWLWCMAYVYSVWGLLPVVIGLMIFGVGVVAVAMLAALVHGDWSNLGMFVLTFVASTGFRILGHWLAEKVDERAARLHASHVAGQTHRIE